MFIFIIRCCRATPRRARYVTSLQPRTHNIQIKRFWYYLREKKVTILGRDVVAAGPDFLWRISTVYETPNPRRRVHFICFHSYGRRLAKFAYIHTGVFPVFFSFFFFVYSPKHDKTHFVHVFGAGVGK